ncbi:hypothetical protein HK097_000009 [Rhizophlyctis rosea]|uniref:Uncharacterized protein n=1 Tax=Rhizophlyctis rosea TaxID=64517 RepID=A0AAD5X6S2_9FUNG|nr:hypothetical protein HK097_000009 [Rhizophlyctis rosea]
MTLQEEFELFSEVTQTLNAGQLDVKKHYAVSKTNPKTRKDIPVVVLPVHGDWQTRHFVGLWRSAPSLRKKDFPPYSGMTVSCSTVPLCHEQKVDPEAVKPVVPMHWPSKTQDSEDSVPIRPGDENGSPTSRTILDTVRRGQKIPKFPHKNVAKAILAAVKKTSDLKAYLNSSFSLSKGQFPTSLSSKRVDFGRGWVPQIL